MYCKSAAGWLLFAVTPLLSLSAADAPVYEPAIAEASTEGERALAGFRIPDGMKGSLFAAEPMLANPVAFSIDEQGRFFVAETFRQQKGVEDNRYHMQWLHDDLALQTVEERVEMFKKHLGENVADYTVHHDRIRLLVDTDGDGKADKSTVFADGFNNIEDGTGAGVLSVNGDVYYTCIPKLWKLRDTDGDGVADEREALHHGYGVRVAFRGHDMHGLIMGPDGRIYFSIGDRGYNVITKEGTQLVRPDSGAVFRCEPDGTGLEVFAYGLRNPQELAFDDYGNLFTCDNNSDADDEARWVYVVEGGDTGWRMYYQYLQDRGPWSREKLWHPQHEGQAAYIIPPITNISDGPSGLAYYPGVGLPDRYKGHFFLCDFRGGPSNSGIRSFAVKPKGASFELVDSHEFLWNILGTDVDFGLDGSMYVSDWVNGWDGLGKGRIYRFAHGAESQNPIVSETVKLLRSNFKIKTTKQLIELLSHPDRRVRQNSHFALAARSADKGLIETAVSSDNLLARIHAIWAVGQIARREPSVLKTFLGLLNDSQEDIRFQAVRVLGDCDFKLPISNLVQLRLAEKLSDGDETLRVRAQAAISLSRFRQLNSRSTILLEGLRDLLIENADQDPVVRHAGILALSRLPDSAPLLLKIRHGNVALRRGLVLALRRKLSSRVKSFLEDDEASIVVEAARAIHDEPIVDAISDLAAIADKPLSSADETLNDALVRRVMNANFRLGGRENAARVIGYASSTGLSEHLRVEALEELKMWDAPSPIDRVTGKWRPVTESGKRDAAFLASLLRPALSGILNGTAKLRELGAELAAKYGITDVEPQLLSIVRDSEIADATRVAALTALDQLDSDHLGAVVAEALSDSRPAVRVEARQISICLHPARAVKVLTSAIEKGSTVEQQAAITQLARIGNSDADSVLSSWFDKLSDGTAPATVQLDILEAANFRNTPELLAKVTAWESTLNPDDPLAKYRVALEGGSSERGYDIFFGRTAASCRRCHSIQNSGGAVGPELSIIGKEKNREYLLEAIVAPNAKIAKNFETVMVLMASGKVYSGIKKSEDDETLKLMLPDGSIVDLNQEDIEATRPGQSAMPADLVKHLSLADVRDLVEYLAQQMTPAPPVDGHK